MISSNSYADRNAEIRKACAQLPTYQQQGAHLYQQKNYSKALDAFENQAAYTHFCLLNQDDLPKSTQTLTEANLATAYNNVGLTHTKLGQYAWAKAWYALRPEDKKSQYNLSKLPKQLYTDQKIAGEYVRYAGQGAWNRLEVSDQGDHYTIQFYGLRMGLLALIYGPNLGEFTIEMPKKVAGKTNTHTEYHYEDCQIDLDFSNKSLSEQFITVKQHQGDASSCGFGFGVYADGAYHKVK